MMYEQIPVEVLEQYAGKWIVWDQEDQRVVGHGQTLDEAEDQAEKSKTDHLLRVHHVLPPGVKQGQTLTGNWQTGPRVRFR